MAHQSTDMPGADRDDESGKYRPKYPTEDFLDAIDAAGGTAGTQEVADAVGCVYETAYKKLRALEEQGIVESDKFGNARAWSAGDESGREAGETPPEVSDDQRVGQAPAGRTPPERDAEERDETDTLLADLRAHLNAVDAPPKTKHGRAALVDVVRLLREHGTMKTSELKEALYAEYGAHYGSDRAMWESIRRYLEDTPGVDTDAGYGKYGYAGDDPVREALEA